jgi:hypothetical protein
MALQLTHVCILVFVSWWELRVHILEMVYIYDRRVLLLLFGEILKQYDLLLYKRRWHGWWWWRVEQQISNFHML